MENKIFAISEEYNDYFEGEAEKQMVEELASYLAFGMEPKTTPAMWQDVEKMIRYVKRNVFSLSAEGRENAERAMRAYRIKYIIHHMKKTEIMEMLNKFFAKPDEEHPHKSLAALLFEKFHTDVDNLVLVQEKRVVKTEDLENFNKAFDAIFEYPAWVEFDDAATEMIYKKILNDELSDEQIDYFLGASDDLKDYDKLYPVVKHVLMTTKNAHTYWVAGDVLNIIWVAASENEKTEEWIRGEIFEIFFDRLGSVWPLKNRNLIPETQDDDSRILLDAISWLNSLPDLKERLPELPKDYLPPKEFREDANAHFSECVEMFVEACEGQNFRLAAELFGELVEMAWNDKEVKKLEELYNKNFKEAMREGAMNGEEHAALKIAAAGVKSAKEYVASIKREQKNLEKLIKK